MATFAENVSGIGLLSDPLRREIYLYVCAQHSAVGRDETADALGIAHHKAKFHLDKLEQEGLLQSEFVRLTGRTGPGAGRPAKLYRRTSHDIAVSLPGREYELAGRLMADAIAASTKSGSSVMDELNAAATKHGRFIGRTARAADADVKALDLARDALAAHGYEPHQDTEADGLVLANCPFHSLADEHTELVCGMNLALIGGLADEVSGLACSLEPGPDRCCVVVRTA